MKRDVSFIWRQSAVDVKETPFFVSCCLANGVKSSGGPFGLCYNTYYYIERCLGCFGRCLLWPKGCYCSAFIPHGLSKICYFVNNHEKYECF